MDTQNNNDLLENWENAFDNLAATLLLQGINVRHIAAFKLSFEEYVKKLLTAQAAKTRQEDVNIIKKYSIKDHNNSNCAKCDKFCCSCELCNCCNRINLKDLQQQILDDNNMKDEKS